MSGLPTAASVPDGVSPVLPLPDLGTPAPLPAADGLTRGHVIALTTVAFVVAIGAELLSASHWSPDAHPSQLELVTDALIGLSFLLVGIVVWDSRPGMRVGLLMYATGLAFFIGNLSASAVPLLHHLGMALPGLWLVGLGVLVLAYPGDRLEHRVDRVLAVVALAWVVLTGVGLVTQLDPTRCVPAVCPANPFRIDVGVNLAPAFATAASLGGILWALVGVRLVQRWWNASPSTRRALTPLWAAAGVMAIATVGKAVLDVAVGDHPAALLFDVLPMLVPIALGAGVLRARIDQASVGDLVVRLGTDPADEELADAVARAAGDPSLVLAIPDADGQLVDVRGQLVAPPDRHRRMTRIEADGDLLAVLIHDEGLEANPGLLRSVAAATRLALENRRLAATVQGQLAEVRASRSRIIEASDAERERIERNLHDGAQQRLVALALRLRVLAANANDPDEGHAVDAAADELDEALAELRDLARGIHPTAVVQGGLASAVEALAERTPIPVSVDVPEGRWPAGIEVAAYFVVAEAITNAVRHAGASRAEVSASVVDGRLRIAVSDDGVGGADPRAGTGLGGLADRLAALGGTLEVVSPVGGGTVIVGLLPVTAA